LLKFSKTNSRCFKIYPLLSARWHFLARCLYENH
jgi:hypothetical protein